MTSSANVVINRLFNNSSTESSRVAFFKSKLILITIDVCHNFSKNSFLQDFGLNVTQSNLHDHK